jgi:hypothetical protein
MEEELRAQLASINQRLDALQDRLDGMFQILSVFRTGNEQLLTQIDLALRSAMQAVQSDVITAQNVSTEIQDRLEADTTKAEVLSRIAALEANQAVITSGIQSVLTDTQAIKTDVRERIPTSTTPEPEAGSVRP